MTLPPFDLHPATTVDEARELLVSHGDDAAVICGGTELLLLLKLGYATYGHLVDVRHIPELGGIHLDDGTLTIGATVTHREIERSPIDSLLCVRMSVATICQPALGSPTPADGMVV